MTSPTDPVSLAELWKITMAPVPRSQNTSSVDQGSRGVITDRITVDQLLLHYRELLSNLPGEVSHFDQNAFGYEWRCELQLDTNTPPLGNRQTHSNRPLELHFSLMDLDRHTKPAAALCLVEYGSQATQHRLFIALGNLADTQEQLNEHLLQRNASVAVYENAHRFLAALTEFRGIVQDQIVWE